MTLISIDCEEDKERWHGHRQEIRVLTGCSQQLLDFAVFLDRKSLASHWSTATADKQNYVNRSWAQQPQFYYNLSVLADTDTMYVSESILQMSVHQWTLKQACPVDRELKVD